MAESSHAGVRAVQQSLGQFVDEQESVDAEG